MPSSSNGNGNGNDSFGYQSRTYRLEGVVPVIPHNGQLADPLNDFAKAIKAISKKRAKTEDDYAKLARLEWEGSFYLDDNGKPVIPGENVEAMLVAAAKKKKQGPAAKAGIIVVGVFPIEYDGPKDLPKLWEDEQFRKVSPVVVQRSRVIRTRPQFPTWALEVEVHFLPDQLDPDDLDQHMVIAGRIIGLCDWRPNAPLSPGPFGRFKAKIK